MKRSLLTILWATTLAGAAVAQQSPKTQKTVPWARYNQGVHWESSLDEAFKKAEKLGKPVLLHQLVGDMKAEGC
jgi:Ni/Co efflux regulator RcnB